MIHQERWGTSTHNNTTRKDPPPLPLRITYQILLSVKPEKNLQNHNGIDAIRITMVMMMMKETMRPREQGLLGERGGWIQELGSTSNLMRGEVNLKIIPARKMCG